MKQRINLYQADLRPLKETLALSSLAIVVLAITVVTLLIWGSIQWQQRQKIKLNIQVTEQLTIQQEQLVMLQQALLQRQPPISLVNERDQLQRHVGQEIALQKYLSLQQSQPAYPFSGVLQQFIEADINTVWLTHFKLRPRSSELVGLTLMPAAVPTWLESLRHSDYFKGQSFNELKLKQLPEHQAVQFHLIAEQGE